MAITITKGYTFGASELVTNTKLHTLVDSATVSIANEAQGDLIYRNASEWTRLPAGNAGEFLITGGSGANPFWTLISVGGGGGGSANSYNFTLTSMTSLVTISHSLTNKFPNWSFYYNATAAFNPDDVYPLDANTLVANFSTIIANASIINGTIGG